MAVLQFHRYALMKKIPPLTVAAENGDYLTDGAEAQWKDCGRCELSKPGGNAAVAKYDGGTVVSYSYTVYLPKDCKEEFKVGDTVRIMLEGALVVEADVKGFMRYQLQSKIWL